MTIKYAGDKGFEQGEGRVELRLSFQEGMSLNDFSEALQEIETIFSVASREVSGKSKTSNGRKSGGYLVVKEFRDGSLEIVADPYFQGVVAGVVANTIFAMFVYALKRIGGRPSGNGGTIHSVPAAVFTPEKAKEVAGNVIALTNTPRKRLRSKAKTFGLRISVKVQQEWIEVIED